MSGAIKLARANSQGGGAGTRAMPGVGYRGDPGFFGTVFGIAKKLGGEALGSLPGGGFAKDLVSRAFGGRSRKRNIGTRKGQPFPPVPVSLAVPRSFAPPRPMQEPVTKVPGFRGFAERMIPGGATGFEVAASVNGMGVPVGYHLNKSGYYRGGRPKSDGPLEWVPEKSIAVKNRKRNALNPRASDRAIGRIVSAKRWAAKLGRITVRKEC